MFNKACKRPASDDDDDIARVMTVKRHSSGQVSPTSTEAVSYTEGCPLTCSDDDSPESPETSDVSKKEVMIRKIIIECESRYMSVETMCQKISTAIMTPEWQKNLRHAIQRADSLLK